MILTLVISHRLLLLLHLDIDALQDETVASEANEQQYQLQLWQYWRVSGSTIPVVCAVWI
jgi:hypothetical protein